MSEVDLTVTAVEGVVAPAQSTSASAPGALMSHRFRGFLPVVIDVETGGFHCATDALLEIAAVLIDIGPDGTLKRGAAYAAKLVA